MRILREKLLKLLENTCTLLFEATIKDNYVSEYLKQDRKQHLTQFDCGSIIKDAPRCRRLAEPSGKVPALLSSLSKVRSPSTQHEAFSK